VELPSLVAGAHISTCAVVGFAILECSSDATGMLSDNGVLPVDG
jgi:hypothetical protein